MQIFPLPSDLEYCSGWDWDPMQFELRHMTFLDQPPAKRGMNAGGVINLQDALLHPKKLSSILLLVLSTGLRCDQCGQLAASHGWQSRPCMCPHKGLRMAFEDAQNEQTFVHATFDKAPITNGMQLQVNLMMHEFIHKASRTECFHSSCLGLQL